MSAEPVDTEPVDTERVGRRGALKAGAAAVAGAVVGGAGVAGIDRYRRTHPSPTDRVSPLVRDQPISSSTPIIWRGDPTNRRAALTFDDGPDPVWTPKALDVLAKHQVSATFFMLGEAVAAHPELARQVAQAGHEIGSHSWDHAHLTTRSGADLDDSLTRTEDAIRLATGTEPRLMRPPYGQFDAESAWAIGRHGYPIVLWSHRMTADNPADRAAEIRSTATPGMIILSHDGRGTPTDVQMQAADSMLGELIGAGWQFVTVSALLRPPP